MKNINHITIVSDNMQDLEFLELKLTRNGFKIQKYSSLKDALSNAKNILPDLIVINTPDVEIDMEAFNRQTNTTYIKKILFPGQAELSDYLAIQTAEHIIIKELSLSKSLRNKKIIFFAPQKIKLVI